MGLTFEEARLLADLDAGRTIVVNVRKRGPHARLAELLKADDRLVYVGRAGRFHDWPCHPLANPHRTPPGATREEVVSRYAAWLQTRPDLLALVPSLRGKALGCWCAPAICHAGVLASIAEEGRT
jgi:hypothetical protein